MEYSEPPLAADLRAAAAEVRALRDQRDTAVAEAAERLIARLMEDYAWDTDDVREILAARDALLDAVIRPPTGTPRMMQSIWPKKVGVDTVDLADSDDGTPDTDQQQREEDT
jgi:hypothetical protein